MLERALPGLFQFQKESGWLGEGGRVRTVLAQAWAALQADNENYLRFINEAVCDGALPDSEDFTSCYISTAIDTVDLACNLLAFLEGGNLGLLARAAMARLETVDGYAQIEEDLDLSDADAEERIGSHRLVREEVDFLDGDLAALKEAPSERGELVSWVLERIDVYEYRKPRLPRARRS